MSALSILPDALSAAHAVFKSLNGRLASRLGLGWQPGPGSEIISRVFCFFANNLADLGDQPFGLKIEPRQNGALGVLSTAIIRDELMKGDGTILIIVDAELRIIAVEQMPPESDIRTWVDAMQEASVAHVVFYFEARNCLRVFGLGGLIDEFVPSTGEKAGRFGRFSRRSLNYKQAIQDHYEQSVKHATECDHWGSPKDRILRKGLGISKKTEEIFQNSLLHWLRRTLTDGTPWPEPRKPNKDRADIKIVTLAGRFYLIEIKWMGTSGGTTFRNLDRLTKGLKQLEQYLKEQPCPAHATLVVYDGRQAAEFEKLLASDSPVEGVKILCDCEGFKVPVGGSCCVFFLFSKRASEL